MSEPELDYVRTDDGWRIALHRYRGHGIRRRHAVVLCHGLAANRVAFDAHPDVSLARHLAAHGYEVLSLELRGHGHSERPSRRGGRRFGWAFDDYLKHDLPAALEHAARLTGATAVHWIGHSMGGVLLYAHLASGGSGTIRSGIAVGSSLDYSASASGFHALLRFKKLARFIPAIPVGPVARLSAALIGRVTTPFETFNVWPSNVDPAVWRRVCEEGFHWVSTPVMIQLASAIEPLGLRSRHDDVHYLAGLTDASAPVLSLAGDRDEQCPEGAARSTLEALGSKRREHLVFGPEHGHRDHYGHFDLLMGRRARDEVFPHVERWLEEHD